MAASLTVSASPSHRRAIHILCLVTDAHGRIGGIAQHNRDVLGAFSRDPRFATINVLPRRAPGETGPLPPKVTYDLRAAGGPVRFAASALRHVVSNRPLDVVFCAHINLLPFARLIGARRKVPVVLQIYGIDAWQPTPRTITNRLVAGVAHTLSISVITRDRFCAWSGFPPARTTIVPSTLHREQLGPGPKPADLVERYGLEGRRVVLTFGRLVGAQREKGFDRVLEALPRLVRELPGVVYVIAGRGPDQARLEQKARTLGMADHCVFTGFVPDDRKADLYRLADAFAMPSKGEGFGIVLLEAMACGIPVVGSTKDGTREALLDGVLGDLVDPDDSADVARGIARALSRPKLVPSGLDHFSYDRFCARMSDAIAEVVDRRPEVR